MSFGFGPIGRLILSQYVERSTCGCRSAPAFWSFTFSWCAAAALGIRWLEATEPDGASTYAALIAAAASLLVGAIAVRSLVALRPT